MSTNNERYELNKNLAQMLKGGVIMDVTTQRLQKLPVHVLLWRWKEFRLTSALLVEFPV